MSVLLTGGAGFIGSHTAVELLNQGYDVVIADNLSNSDISVLHNIEKITGKKIPFCQADVTNKDATEKIFRAHHIEAVIHFAGYKAVGESVAKPLMYYRNNVDSALTILEVMQKFSCRTIIFSSSATVYGEKNPVPYQEDMPTGNCTNPYGNTKFFIERILMDWSKANPNVSVILLRYFNPIGAHESGLIGEKPNGIPNNLMPYITQTAVGIREKLSVFGNDYPTPDGTGVRDYIHVVDLAKGHVAALKFAENFSGTEIFNLGTGHGSSVLEVVHTFMDVNKINVPYRIAPRREGDLAESYAATEKAERLLNWKAEKSLADMCRDSWRWEQKSRGK